MAKDRVRLYDPKHWAEGNPLERATKIHFTNTWNCTYDIFVEFYGKKWCIFKTINCIRAYLKFITEEEHTYNELAEVLSSELGVDKKAARIAIRKVFHKISKQLNEQAKE